MKKILSKKIAARFAALSIAVAALALFSSCYIRAEDKRDAERSISVSGTGSVSVKADQATINVAVVTYNRSVIEAARINAETVAKVHGALADAGFAPDSITTNSYRIWQDSSYRNGVQVRGDYRVSNSIQIVTMDPRKAGTAIDAAVKAGANEFSSIEFSSTKIDNALREARTLAIKNAAEAANLMAKTAGAELGKIISIQESGAPTHAARVEGAKLMAANDFATPINAGDNLVTVTVYCVYELK
ncbi:MAG: SIMPL domain-containing protein [Treponema sp.]|nr:SIMPL domain-containing protein [Treponema sp.]